MKRRWDVSFWPIGFWRWMIAHPVGYHKPFMHETCLGPIHIRVWTDPRSANVHPFRVVRVER
jgi:hypothetical protein